MPKHVKNKLDAVPIRSWAVALREVSRQLELAKRRVNYLETIVCKWTKLRDSGMPWLGEQKENKS